MMKTNLFKLGLSSAVVGLFMMVNVGGAFAVTECANMKVLKAGTKLIAGAKVNVIRVQRASASNACGNMTMGEGRTFSFSDLNGDAGLATALTALSLGQNVYMILTDNNAANATTVEILQVSAP